MLEQYLSFDQDCYYNYNDIVTDACKREQGSQPFKESSLVNILVQYIYQ